MSEGLPLPEAQLNPAQEAALQAICGRYGVEYDPDHYFVYPDDASMMPSWCEGWVGGPEHAHGTERPTIYVGCSPEGGIYS